MNGQTIAQTKSGKGPAPRAAGVMEKQTAEKRLPRHEIADPLTEVDFKREESRLPDLNRGPDDASGHRERRVRGSTLQSPALTRLS